MPGYINTSPEEQLRREDREDQMFGEEKPVMEAYFYVMDHITMKEILRNEDLELALALIHSFVLNNELS